MLQFLSRKSLIGIWAFLFTLPLLSFGQSEKFTISGTLKDASNGEELIGATVTLKEKPGVGASTNVYGYYALTLPTGEYTLVFSFIGFQPVEKKVNLTQNTTISIELEEAQTQLQEVVVTGEREDANVELLKMSTEELKVEQAKILPALMGEVDVVRTLTLLPGVQNAGEGTTGLFVRGGANDQNLILLDDAPVYNASHLLGFFSVFNPDAIKDVQLYKGAIPAEYGSRLSSIVDIRMKEGNNKNLQVSGGIGTISSRLTVEAPIVKDKGSFIVSGRRTYADVFLAFSPNEDIRNNTLYFYDFNAKANYRINENNRIFASGYFGRDVLGFDNSFGINWGNATGTLRWNHIFSQKLFLNTTLVYSNFDYGFDIDDGGTQNFQWRAGLKNVSGKLDFDYFMNPENTLSFGVENIYHTFTPADIQPINNKSIFVGIKLDEAHALETNFYIGNEQKVSDKLSVQYGLRYSIFQNIGSGKEYEYAEGEPKSDETITDTLSYSGFAGRNLYHGLEPRLGVKYTVSPTSSIKGSYNRTRQYVQVVATNTASLPFDRWIPSGRHVEPQIGDQVALGYFRNFKENTFEVSVEGYYKWMQNQADVMDGEDVLINNNIEEAIAFGDGWAYGAEFLVRKNLGNTTGWVSYTWSKTQRQIAEINNGKAYSPRYDRRHDISVVLTHRFTDRLSVSGSWVYSTGSAVTFPIGKYEVDGLVVDYYDPEGRNADRLPDYHRLDLGVTLDGKNKERKRFYGSWSLSVYNAYDRRNAFTIFFRENATNPNQLEAVKQSLFGILPSLTYNFYFTNKKMKPKN